MKAIRLTDSFSLKNLKLVNIDLPPLKEDEVLVEIKARSLNYRDYLMISGKYNPNQKLPFIPLSDGAGTIIEIGNSVENIKVGDSVINLFALNWFDGAPPQDMFCYTLGGPLNGTWSEYRIFHKNEIVVYPSYLNFSEASTLPCAALTAYNSLITYGKIEPSNTILVIGTGGVSMFAIQIALKLGCEVIVLSGSESKIEFLQKIGVDSTKIINYKKHPHWYKQVLQLTNNKGVDLVVEVGGVGTLENSMRSVKKGGHISLIGVLAGGVGELHLRYIFMNNVCMQGIIVGSKKDLENLCLFFERYKIHPIVDKIFSFEDTSCIEYLSQSKHIGKVCVS